MDGSGSDFFSVLSIIFEYAFERNCENEGSGGSKELKYLLDGGLVKAMARVYKTLSRQMIVEGKKVDRSLAALCKTCLSIFEEVPTGIWIFFILFKNRILTLLS